MSLGFSAGDLIATLKLAKGVYDACRDGPTEYRVICSETKSLKNAMQGLRNDAKDPNSLLNRKGLDRTAELDEIISNCARTLGELQILVDKHSSLKEDFRTTKLTRIWDAYRLGSCDLDSLRGRLTFHTSTIGVFLLSLEGPAIARIETKLDEIYARLAQNDAVQARHSTTSLASIASTTSLLSQIESNEDDAWVMLKRELLLEGIPMAHVLANRDDIIDYIRSLLESGVSENRPGAAAGTRSETDELNLLPSSPGFPSPPMGSRSPAINPFTTYPNEDFIQTSMGMTAIEDLGNVRTGENSTTRAMVHKAKVKAAIENLKSLFDSQAFGKIDFEDSFTAAQQLDQYLEESRRLVTSLEVALFLGSNSDNEMNQSDIESWRGIGSKFEQDLDELGMRKINAKIYGANRGIGGKKPKPRIRTKISSPQFISTTNAQVLQAADLIDPPMNRDGPLDLAKRVSVTRSVPH